MKSTVFSAWRRTLIVIVGVAVVASVCFWNYSSYRAEQAAISTLMDAIKEKNPPGIVQAVEQVKAIPAGGEAAVPALIDALGDVDPEIRAMAMLALRELGPDAVPLLVIAFNQDNPQAQVGALYALRQLGPAAAPGL